MIPIVTSRQMRGIDNRAINTMGIPGMDLMENAGRLVADEVQKVLTELGGGKIAVIAGRGNNGGDGFVAARHLSDSGISVDVFLLGAKELLRGDALANHERLGKEGKIAINYVTDAGEMELSEFSLVVDSILGTGATGDLRGLVKDAVEKIAGSGKPVIAVDMPTGVDADTGNAGEPSISAEVTVTMGLPKKGQLFSPGREKVGRLVVADIGFPPQAIEEEGVNLFQPELADIKAMLPTRASDVYKQQAGKVLVAGGSRGMTGAPVLASKAALIMGAGLVVTAVPESLNQIFEVKLTEEMTLPLSDTPEGVFSEDSFTGLGEYLGWADVLAIGPGMRTAEPTMKFIGKTLESTRSPVVIDADGLMVFRERQSLLTHLGESAVLTPHHGEFSEAFEIPLDRVKSDPVGCARDAVSKYGVNVVLKGAPTVTATVNDSIYVNPTGNPGMATAGSGDVLTGMIASLIGQGMKPAEAAVAGVYLHGLAGDVAVEKRGILSTIASDILDAIPEAIGRVVES